MTKSIVRSVVAAMAVALSGIASAQSTQAVEWKVSDGGNGHWYGLVRAANGRWPESAALASTLGGTLASITSADEDSFLQANFDGILWIGLRRSAQIYTEFQWITNEPFSYARWQFPEPSGCNPCGEAFFVTWSDETWDDTGYEPNGEPQHPGFSALVEFDADCNGDGIVDYGQIRRGELPDFNGNNIPDCCESGSTCTVGGSVPVQWRAEDGGNGHWYMMSYNEETRFFARQAMAVSMGAHLATLQSVDEHAFVFTVAESQQGFSGSEGWPALGGFRAPNSAAWNWVTGEPFAYAPWPVGEPNGNIGLWAYIQMWGANSLPNLTIDDNTTEQFGECGINRRVMLEWDADCNGDGVVDLGQILRGDLLDSDADGIPDVCEAVIAVPAERPTIQAAIDAATSTRNVILVSEGTYNEAIDFKGKAVTVKAVGARANTIIDGTGKTTSVVRAVTGETSATLLEGFTIRNGPVGSERNSLRLGGGMYIANASPTVRNCAFVNNAAGYGGGLYGLYSNALVENCTFSQNFATSDAGGLQFFGGSPVIRNCVISDNTSTYRGGGVHLVQWVSGFPTLEGCTVTGNRSQVSEGGGVSVVPDVAAGVKCVVTDCTITGNTAQGRGGGLHAPVNTVGAPQASVVLANNTICDNTSAVSKRENTWLLFEDGGNAICDCFSDVDGNGTVDFGDLAFTLLFVGDVTDPDFIQPDQDMNGLIDTGDIALLLLNFGPCS